MLFKTLAERWLLDLRNRSTPRTHGEAEYRVRVLSDRLGDKPYVSPDDVRSYVKHRRETCSVATVNGDLTTLRALCRWGRKQGYWFRIPEIHLLPAPIKVPRTIPRDGIERLLQVSEGRLRVFVLLARFTLARHQEVLGLRWSDVDFETGAVTIRRPKGHRERVVFVPEPVLLELHDFRGTQRYAQDSDWIFQSRKRRRQRVGTLHKDLREAFQRAGIYRPGLPTTHALRHTGASELIRSTDIYTLAEIMGHRDIQTTLVYLHTTDERKKQAVDALL